MKLPQIYTHFNQGQVFTIDEASRKLGTKGNTLRKRLSDLSMRGYISPIRQGLYRLSKLSESKFEKKIFSPYEIACKLTPYCYLGYKTALQFHANQMIPENDKIYVISNIKFNGFKFDTKEYIWCQTSESHGIETHTCFNDGRAFELRTTNLERTLIDCLKRPAHSPSFQELMALCDKLPMPPDIDTLLSCARKLNVRSLFNRLGYLIEKNQMTWDVPNSILFQLEALMSRKPIDWTIHANIHDKNRWKIQFLNSNCNSNSHSRF